MAHAFFFEAAPGGETGNNKKILRAKTFRHNSEKMGLDYNDNLDSVLANLPHLQPKGSNFVEALRHRAKSSSRINEIEKSRYA